MKKSFVILFSFSLFLMGCGGEESVSEDSKNRELADTTNIVKDGDPAISPPLCSEIVMATSKIPYNNSIFFLKDNLLLYPNNASDTILLVSGIDIDSWGGGQSIRVFAQLPNNIVLDTNGIVKKKTKNINNSCFANGIIIEIPVKKMIPGNAQLYPARTFYFDVNVSTNEWLFSESIILQIFDTKDKKKKRVVASHPDKQPDK